MILHDDILNSVQGKIDGQQHGFLSGQSVVTNLYTFSCYASKAIQDKHQLDTIYVDCAEAFDKVDHKVLLDRLV